MDEPIPGEQNNLSDHQTDSEPVFLATIPYWLRVAVGALFAIFLLTIIVFYCFLSAPDRFEVPSTVRIAPGVTIGDTAEYLYDRELIRSRTVFKILMYTPLARQKIVAGDYLFEDRLSSLTIVWRFGRGYFNLKPYKLTIPEGVTVRQIGAILEETIPALSADVFYQTASSSEGYLFPDTYFISPLANEQEVFALMRDNFDDKIRLLRPRILLSGFNEHEIITLASLLELEASSAEDRRIISGILRNRLDLDMRLQVDAIFPYILGKNTFEVTTKDLQYDSPYNTYRYKGLPPGPIGNPSLDAIKAAFDPTKSDYVYYLHDKTGAMHYTETYTEHLKNKAKYLTK